MAKTRIKTTPTRMQKEALIASAAVTTTTNVNIRTEHVLKKRLTAFNHSMLNKEAIPSTQSTIIVQPPKRTNSISSITSTISHTSDGCSSVESSSPLRLPTTAPATTTISPASTPTNSNGPTMAELTENAIKTLNAGLLAKSTALALKNRKVYMITEKCDDSYSGNNLKNNGGGRNNAGSLGGLVTGNGQKRKMYLIMEEKETDIAEKFMKSECSSGAKKLTLFTDTANGQLPQKIEKILPEILNCIQAKGAAGISATGTANNVATKCNTNGNDCPKITQTVSQNFNSRSLLKLNENSNIENNDRLPLTLPPKKNRTKIITTQIIPVNTSSCPTTTQANKIASHGKNGEGCHLERGVTTVYCSNGNGNRNRNDVDTHSKAEKSSATPVIVNANTLLAANGSNNGAIKLNGCTLPSLGSAPQMHKNINLSTDFLFLMKMLPKLESISETHKNYVKSSIEDLINQYSTIDPVEDQ